MKNTPQSTTWKRENSLSYSLYQKNEQCCIKNCKSKKSIRNFSCLKGKWQVKTYCNHKKICVFHYNLDLKENPRRRSKRHKCCIIFCDKKASDKNIYSLNCAWKMKDGNFKKICEWHSKKDKERYEFQTGNKNMNGIELLLAASYFV